MVMIDLIETFCITHTVWKSRFFLILSLYLLTSRWGNLRTTLNFLYNYFLRDSQFVITQEFFVLFCAQIRGILMKPFL